MAMTERRRADPAASPRQWGWPCLLCSLLITGCFSDPGESPSNGSSTETASADGSGGSTTGAGTASGGAEATTSSGAVAESTGGTAGSTTSDSATVTGSSSTWDSESGSTGDSVDPSLVVWLQFEEDPVVTAGALDSSGNGFDAICVTACPTQIEGPPGRGSAALFSDSELLTVSDAPEFHLTEALSVAAWVRLDAEPTTEYSVVFGRNGSPQSFNAYGLSYRSGGDHLFDVGEETTPAAPAVLGEWVHIAGTWSASSGLARIYLNGETQGATSAPLAPTYPVGDLLIGSDFNAVPVLPFVGAIDDLRLYNRELSPADIAELAR